jgi:NADPH2:quinone reductase
MKAWLMDDYTGVEHLRLADVPEPHPGDGEAVLELRYAALNPADRYLSERQYPAKPTLPHILGREGVGQIVKIRARGGSDELADKRFSILRGDVGGNRPGTFAQRVSVPVQDLIETPPSWSDEESAGATLVYLTAYQALTMWGPLPQSSVILVTGASGGVGVAVVQLALAIGHTVVGLSRSSEKQQRLKTLGATLTFNPEEPRWRQAVRDELAPRRVDLAVDNIGGKLLPQVIETLADLGKVSLVGRLAGPVPEFNTASLFFRRIRIGGVAVGAYTNAESRDAWQAVLKLMQSRGARPVIDSVFPFADLKKAFERLAQGPMGKVLIQI